MRVVRSVRFHSDGWIKMSKGKRSEEIACVEERSYVVPLSECWFSVGRNDRPNQHPGADFGQYKGAWRSTKTQAPGLGQVRNPVRAKALLDRPRRRHWDNHKLSVFIEGYRGTKRKWDTAHQERKAREYATVFVDPDFLRWDDFNTKSDWRYWFVQDRDKASVVQSQVPEQAVTVPTAPAATLSDRPASALPARQRRSRTKDGQSGGGDPGVTSSGPSRAQGSVPSRVSTANPKHVSSTAGAEGADSGPSLPVLGRPRVQDNEAEATAMVASGAAMVDSGAGKHLTSKKRCSPEELEHATPTDVVLLTAKGEERVDKEVEMYLDALGVNVAALALDDCPHAVSLGRRSSEGKLAEGKAADARNVEITGNPASEGGSASSSAPPPDLVVVGVGGDAAADPSPLTSTGEAVAVPPPPEIVEERSPTKEQRLREVAKTMDHFICHFPKNPYCDICNGANIMQKRFHRKKGDEIEKADKFGDLLLVDHIVFGKDEEAGYDGETSAVFVADDATDLRDMVPVSSKSADEAELAVKTFTEGDSVGAVFSDRSRELKAMAKRNKWVHRRATPHRPEAHGKLEIKVRYTKEATRCNLRQSRLPHKWWTFAGRHACVARNVWRKGTDGLSAYERKHGLNSFTGQLVPFGMGIQFRPTKPNRERLLEFDSRAVDGVFLGWDI